MMKKMGFKINPTYPDALRYNARESMTRYYVLGY